MLLTEVSFTGSSCTRRSPVATAKSTTRRRSGELPHPQDESGAEGEHGHGQPAPLQGFACTGRRAAGVARGPIRSIWHLGPCQTYRCHSLSFVLSLSYGQSLLPK